MTRRIRYQVACSLDGYIADEQGGADWIVHEPTIDFAELFAQFDTFLMGRKTYEGMLASPGPGSAARRSSSSSRGRFAPKTIPMSRSSRTT